MSGEPQDDTRRQFHTLDAVGAATGILVNPVDGMAGIHGLLAYVLGDEGLMTHQLPAALHAARPVLVEQHPWLADANPPQGDLPALAAWNADVVLAHGRFLSITPAKNPPWQRGNALTDLAAMMRPDQSAVVVVVPEGKG